MSLPLPDPPLSDGVVALRSWLAADIDQLVEACADPVIHQFIPIPDPYTRADAEAYVARTQRQWADGSKAAFAIVAADDPARLLGAINVAVFETVGNSAYWVAPWARRQGVATRALQLVTRWAEPTLGLGVILLEIRPENVASMAVARAAGYHDAGRVDVNTATGKKGGRIFTRLIADP